MNTFNLINRILSSTRIQQVFDTKEITKSYKKALGILHPDVCHLPHSIEAFVKLNQLKSEFDRGKIIKDDAGEFEVKNNVASFRGDEKLLQVSYDHFQMLKEKRDKASLSFHKYIPEGMGLTSDLQVMFKERTVPVSRLVLPQKHVLWILSRLLETCAWFSQIGYVHGGLNPESILIVPETHGIIIGSFYHLTKKNQRLRTVSAKYKHWYPEEVFKDKRARTKTDLELVKRTAAYLLGDPSGVGIKLKKTHHPALLAFLLKQHTNAYECYDDYRKMLKVNFEVKFSELIL